MNKLLIFYDYFYPGYKAGGPIQSLTNLALALQKEYTISLITGGKDLQSTEIYREVTINQWNKVWLPGSEAAINVYYAGDKELTKASAHDLIKEAAPDVVYLNGIYSFRYFLFPLLALKRLKGNYKVVVCPRGMLQVGALAVKPLKKKLYLSYLRLTGLLKNAYWHATNQEELQDIQKNFPANKGIVIASNIPKPPYDYAAISAKVEGQLKLVYLSLITEKKNLLLLLQVIQSAESGVTLDIYGPVKDEAYWTACEGLIAQMPGRVTYKGDVQPVKVQDTLSKYDALILLTKGENFGHALYESLSVGRPIITSHFTPWVDLEEKKAGWNVDISNGSLIVELLNKLVDMDTEEWKGYCEGAHQLAVNYFDSLDTEIKYKELFGVKDGR